MGKVTEKSKFIALQMDYTALNLLFSPNCQINQDLNSVYGSLWLQDTNPRPVGNF